MVDVKPKDAKSKEAKVQATEEVSVVSRTEPDRTGPETHRRKTAPKPELVTLDQVEALLKYVIDHRIDVRDALTRDLYKAVMRVRDAASDEQKSAAREVMTKAYIALAHAATADPLPLEQVEALIQYAAERGLNTPDDVLVKLYKALADYKAARDASARTNAGAELIRYYSVLARLTYDKSQINGKTLMGTKHSGKEALIVLSIGIAFFVLAGVNGIIGLYSGATAGEETTKQAMPLYRYALSYLSPFFWGGLGACVFIAKRVADETADLRFDYERFRGVAVRIFLGAVLGGLAVSIFDFEAFGKSGFTLQSSVIAFLAGLGYKVVYGSFEKAVEAIAEKLNLAALRQPKAPTPGAGVESSTATPPEPSAPRSEATPTRPAAPARPATEV